MIDIGALGCPTRRWPGAAPLGTRAVAPAPAWLALPDGTFRPLGHETRIGRRAGNDIVLGHHGVSRAHAIIRRSGSDFVLSDLGSTHGTLINEQPLTSPHRLTDGDRIWLCTTELRFSSAPPAGGPPARKPWWKYLLGAERPA
jgi:hypothetical protein